MHEPKAPSTSVFKTKTKYERPRTGILSWIPYRWLPYAELARLDKPGFALLWIVHLCGVLQASIMEELPSNQVCLLALYFLIPCQVLMWVNFSWNDTCDVEFDRKVFRTQHRPLARNVLNRRQALAFDCLLFCFMISFLLPLPSSCSFYAIPLAFGCLIYPLTKRCTNYPQACLGVILAGGTYMGAAAAGVNGLPFPTRLDHLFWLSTWFYPSRQIGIALGSNYLTIMLWVISTEIIYSYQDAEWDEGAGVRTITRIIPSHTTAKALLFSLAGGQVLLFGFTGMILDFQLKFWRLSLGLMAASLGLTISKVDLKNPESCLRWFQIGNVVTGTTMLLGYGMEYYFRARVS